MPGKQELMSQIAKIGTYQSELANDLLRLVNNQDRDGTVYSALKKEFKFSDSDSIYDVVSQIAKGLDDTYKERGSGRIFNEVFNNPTPREYNYGNSYNNNNFQLSSLKSDGSADVRPVTGYGDMPQPRMTLSNRPLTNLSPMAGPYYCPEIPDRVVVDGIIVVNKPDQVRDFYNGKVMVLHVKGGNPEEFDRPGTVHCSIVDKYRKAIREYEKEYQQSASRGHDLIPWTFYLDNVGFSDDEIHSDLNDVTVPLRVGAAAGDDGVELEIRLSRFDGRNDFGYRKVMTFENVDDMKHEKLVSFFRRAKGAEYEVYADKYVGDSKILRFVEFAADDDRVPGMDITESSRERVCKFLKSDDTMVILITRQFVEAHGFDDKIMKLTDTIKSLCMRNPTYYDRIAYYFRDEDLPEDNRVLPKYKITNDEVDWARASVVRKRLAGRLFGNNAFIEFTSCVNATVDDLNDVYNVVQYAANEDDDDNNMYSSSAIFQIIRGSKNTTVMEMYIAKDEPNYYTPYSYAEKNELTEDLCLQNVFNMMAVPYVSETLLDQFLLRTELFPVLTSESRARRFYVRPLRANPFVTEQQDPCFIFRHDQLLPRMVDDLKRGRAIILYPECDGTEGSCIPPQLQGIADRYNAVLHSAHRDYFDFRYGAKVVLMRAERKLSHQNFELYMTSGTRWTQYNAQGQGIPVANPEYNPASCKFSSTDLDIPRIIAFLSKERVSNRNFRIMGRQRGARQYDGLASLWA